MSGLGVLRYLAGTSVPLGVTRIARDLDLHSSTCFNLLKTLVHERLVNFDDSGMLRPPLEAVAARRRVIATLWHRMPGERVLLVDRADNESAVRVHMSIGQRLPMYIAALGRCMAVHSGLSAAELRLRVSELRWDASPSFEQYLAEVDEARRLGYAVDRSQYVKGVTTASAAILDSAGRPIMAISAVGFAAQLDAQAIQSLGEDLRDRATEISRVLSGRLPELVSRSLKEAGSK